MVLKSKIIFGIRFFIYFFLRLNVKASSAIRFPFSFSSSKYIYVGNKCRIGRFSKFNAIRKYRDKKYLGSIYIGDNTYIGGYCNIHSIRKLVIGKNVVISENVFISDNYHGLDRNQGLIMDRDLESKGGVFIENDVFIGHSVVVMSGVTIGEGAIIGAHSIVNKNIPAHTMAVGMPTKIVKTYDFELNKWVPV